MASAWGRPPGAVQPQLRMRPDSSATTAPTAGFGQHSPSPRAPSCRASRIAARSFLFEGAARRDPLDRESIPLIFAKARPLPLPAGPRGQLSLGLGVVALADLAKHGFKIPGFAEVFVYRRKANISDVIEFAKLLHDQLADFLRADLAVTETFQLARYGTDELVDMILVEWPLAQCDLQRAGQLVAVEYHAPAAALENHQLTKLHALKSGETTGAFRAKAAPPDRRMVFGGTGVLHLRIVRAAIGAPHSAPRSLL